MLYKVTGAGHSVCVWGGVGWLEGQSSMVHGAKERRGERRERVELPDSLMNEAVLQSAGPRLETTQSPP